MIVKDCTPKIKLSDTESPLQRWVDLSAGACGDIILKGTATLIKIPADSWQARWSHITQVQGLTSRVFKDCAGRKSGLVIFWVKPNCLFFWLKNCCLPYVSWIYPVRQSLLCLVLSSKALWIIWNVSGYYISRTHCHNVLELTDCYMYWSEYEIQQLQHWLVFPSFLSLCNLQFNSYCCFPSRPAQYLDVYLRAHFGAPCISSFLLLFLWK